MIRCSKVQFSKIALYWAGLTVAFAILWSVYLNFKHLAGRLAGTSLVVPMLIGAMVSVLLYYGHDHMVLEYDDEYYSIRKGRAEASRHDWTEFKECSVAKDSYGRNKVRIYLERDGHHLDIDSSASGLDPYPFRNFILEHIRRTKLERSPIIEGLEREIQRGRASWVADLNETFRDYQVSGDVFSLVARGGTRPKGFLLSRFVAYTLMPNYNVCLYVSDLHMGENTRSEVMRKVRILETQRDQKNIKWSWLLLLSDDDPPSATLNLIEQFGNKDVGIGFINTTTGQVATSPNQLGRSLTGQMRMNRLIRDIRRRKSIEA